MLSKAAAAALFLLLEACQTPGIQKSGARILIGATTITGAGAVPIPDSVIIVSGLTIRAVGLQKDLPIPQDSERLNLAGKWVVPAEGGQIAAGARANLLVLDHPPSGLRPARAEDTSRRMRDGEWESAH